MKQSVKLFSTLLLFLVITSAASAQCYDLVESKGFQYLDTNQYRPEGRFNAFPLREGDNIDIYKSFFKGRKYRVVVIGAANMPKLNFKIKTFQRQLLYDSNVTKMESYDFISDKNQNLIISVEVPRSGKSRKKKITGCIAVLVGYTSAS